LDSLFFSCSPVMQLLRVPTGGFRFFFFFCTIRNEFLSQIIVCSPSPPPDSLGIAVSFPKACSPFLGIRTRWSCVGLFFARAFTGSFFCSGWSFAHFPHIFQRPNPSFCVFSPFLCFVARVSMAMGSPLFLPPILAFAISSHSRNQSRLGFGLHFFLFVQAGFRPRMGYARTFHRI